MSRAPPALRWPASWRIAGRAVLLNPTHRSRTPIRRPRTRLPRDWTMSPPPPPTAGFHVSHFFVLRSLMAAAVAVVMARPAAPEHLILISLTVGAAGLAGLCFYRLLAPPGRPPA